MVPGSVEGTVVAGFADACVYDAVAAVGRDFAILAASVLFVLIGIVAFFLGRVDLAVATFGLALARVVAIVIVVLIAVVALFIILDDPVSAARGLCFETLQVGVEHFAGHPSLANGRVSRWARAAIASLGKVIGRQAGHACTGGGAAAVSGSTSRNQYGGKFLSREAVLITAGHDGRASAIKTTIAPIDINLARFANFSVDAFTGIHPFTILAFLVFAGAGAAALAATVSLGAGSRFGGSCRGGVLIVGGGRGGFGRGPLARDTGGGIAWFLFVHTGLGALVDPRVHDPERVAA